MIDDAGSEIRIAGRITVDGKRLPGEETFRVEVWEHTLGQPLKLLGTTYARDAQFDVEVPAGAIEARESGSRQTLLIRLSHGADAPVMGHFEAIWQHDEEPAVLYVDVELAGLDAPAAGWEAEKEPPRVEPERPSGARGMGGRKRAKRGGDAGYPSDEVLESVVQGARAAERLADLAEYWPAATGGRATASGAGYRTSSAGTGTLRDIIDGAFATVLGRTFSEDEEGARQFDEALAVAFTPVEEDGHTEYRYNSAVALPFATQSGGGAKLTGGQASLFDQFKTVIGRTQELLKSVKPLSPAPDNVEVEAVRIIVSTTLDALLREVGRDGGPLVPAVKNLFQVLEKELDRWEDIFDLSRDHAINVEREGSYTTFNTVRWNVRMLDTGWNEYLKDAAVTPYLGAQIARLTDALNRVPETVAGVEQVMDKLGFYPSDRRGAVITFERQENGKSVDVEMTVDAVLQGLVMDFVAMAYKLVTKTGKRGVEIIAAPARTIAGYVQDLAICDCGYPALDNTRVRQMLNELAGELEDVAELADQLMPAGAAAGHAVAH